MAKSSHRARSEVTASVILASLTACTAATYNLPPVAYWRHGEWAFVASVAVPAIVLVALMVAGTVSRAWLGSGGWLQTTIGGVALLSATWLLLLMLMSADLVNWIVSRRDSGRALVFSLAAVTLFFPTIALALHVCRGRDAETDDTASARWARASGA